MISEAGAALGGIKAAFDIVKAISTLKTDAEINDALFNIRRILLEAQESALADKQTISELRLKIEDFEREQRSRMEWETEKKRYVLFRSPMGAYVYALRPELANGEIPHRLCTTCYEDGRKSVLHTMASHSGGEMVICQRCDKRTVLADFQATSNYSSDGEYF